MHAALGAIAETLAGYARAVVEAGASGLFYAIVRLAREGVLTRGARDVRPALRSQGARGSQGAPFSLLHLCGPKVYFDQVADYPVQAINWAAVGQGNPDVGEALRRTKLALIGGVDEDGALRRGDAGQVTAEARAAIRATGGRRLLLAPGCSVAMDTPESGLRALRAGRRGATRARDPAGNCFDTSTEHIDKPSMFACKHK